MKLYFGVGTESVITVFEIRNKTVNEFHSDFTRFLS
jgi:hypothetical protein